MPEDRLGEGIFFIDRPQPPSMLACTEPFFALTVFLLVCNRIALRCAPRMPPDANFSPSMSLLRWECPAAAPPVGPELVRRGYRQTPAFRCQHTVSRLRHQVAWSWYAEDAARRKFFAASQLRRQLLALDP